MRTAIPPSFRPLEAHIQLYSELKELGLYSPLYSEDQMKAIVGQLLSSLQKLCVESTVTEHVEMEDMSESGRVEIVVVLVPTYEEEMERIRRS